MTVHGDLGTAHVFLNGARAMIDVDEPRRGQRSGPGPALFELEQYIQLAGL